MPKPTGDFTSVFLIDDDEVDLMFIQRELNKLDIPVSFEVARDGVDALNKLLGRENEAIIPRPKIIVLDLMMPRMSGIEFLEILRAYPQFDFLDVLVLTTSNNENDKMAASQLNVAGYFVKDTQFDGFIDCCKLLLEKHRI